jgi:shikimate kinase
MLQSFASPEHQRPVLSSPAEAEARLRSRLPHYRRLAQVTVATEDLTPQQTVEAVLDRIAR